jgi:hypothetical protein
MKKVNRRRLIPYKCLLIIFIASILGCSKNSLIEKSNQWDTIRFKEYFVENNTWNVQTIHNNWSQTIFCDTLSGMLGWKWDFSGEENTKNKDEVKTFPEIVFGKKPYSNYQSTTSLLPERLNVAKISLNYEYRLEATGIYNLTTDISFSDSINPVEKNIRAKLMIWFISNNMKFNDAEKLKTAMIGGHHYKIYIDTTHVGPEGKWNFIALLPDNLPSKGEINFKDYFDYLLSEGVIKPEWYLSSIELGSEIASGKGKITFNKFEVHSDSK